MLFGIGFGRLGVFPTSSGLLKVSLQSVHVMVSGKSTTTHFMVASQMLLDQRIGHIGCNKVCFWCDIKDLIMLCHASDFDDTSGAEVDVANELDVVTAIETVRIILKFNDNWGSIAIGMLFTKVSDTTNIFHIKDGNNFDIGLLNTERDIIAQIGTNYFNNIYEINIESLFGSPQLLITKVLSITHSNNSNNNNSNNNNRKMKIATIVTSKYA